MIFLFSEHGKKNKKMRDFATVAANQHQKLSKKFYKEAQNSYFSSVISETSSLSVNRGAGIAPKM